MDEWKNRLIHLHHCRKVGWKGIYFILKADPELSKLYEHSDEDWHQILRISSSDLAIFRQDLSNEYLKTISSLYEKNHISCLSFLDSYYPATLSKIYHPPWLIYCLGNIGLLSDSRILAVIGTRNPTEYGFSTVNYLIPPLIKSNVCIVSGLAKGIDSHAQKLAIRGNGKVIAVLGGGIFHIYPKENIHLAQQIMQHGVVLSEYPPISKPEPWHFPERNRIISGLSRAILVVEGKRKSGTFITVQHGLEQGKDIYAVPGSIFSAQSAGPNELIYEGAKCIQTAHDIVNEWI